MALKKKDREKNDLSLKVPYLREILKYKKFIEY